MGFFLPISGPATKQPTSPLVVDWRNPLTRGLSGIAVPGAPEAVAKGLQIVSGAFSVQRSPEGAVAAGPAIQTPGYVGWDVPSVSVDGDFTLFMRTKVTQNEGIFSICDFTTTGSLLTSGIHADSNEVACFLDGNLGTVIAVDMSRYRSIVAVRRGNQQILFVDGVQLSSDTTGTRTGAITGITIGRNRSGNSANETFTSLIGFSNSRAWSNAEIAAFARNPWQLFVDPEAAFFFTGAAGGGEFQAAWAARKSRTIGAGVI